MLTSKPALHSDAREAPGRRQEHAPDGRVTDPFFPQTLALAHNDFDIVLFARPRHVAEIPADHIDAFFAAADAYGNGIRDAPRAPCQA